MVAVIIQYNEVYFKRGRPLVCAGTFLWPVRQWLVDHSHSGGLRLLFLQSFSGQSLFVTIAVRTCRLRGVSHYAVDVKAARAKLGRVKTGQLFGVGASISVTQGSARGEFKHGSIVFYFFPVRVILFIVVHYCNCLAAFSTAVSLSLSNNFMAPDCLALPTKLV